MQTRTMSPHVWQKLDAILQRVIDLTPQERQRYIDQNFGHDDAIRAQLESLLTAVSAPWDLLEGSALESGAILFEPEALMLSPGDRVAHYEIIELLGKGGMGEVYLALDEILNRQVAIKILPLDH